MKKRAIFEESYFELTGCIHVHSEYSYDSNVPVKKIIQLAKKTDLDYITINDHSNMKAANETSVKNEKSLTVIVGSEINDKERNNHLLVYNTDKIIKDKTVEEYLREYTRSDAITFAAHPVDTRRSKEFRSYNWTSEDVSDFDGLEIWNFLSNWVGDLVPKLNGLFFVLFPSVWVRKPKKKTLQFWDRLNRSGKRKSGIGCVDAHTERLKRFGINFKFLTHRKLFQTIRTNVLIKVNSEISEINILQALKKGNSYIVNYKIGNPYNFYGGISDGDNMAIFGEEIDFNENMYFYYHLPKLARVKLIRNGEVVASEIDEKGKLLISKKGNYRLEISRFGYGWIYTNNIYVI